MLFQHYVANKIDTQTKLTIKNKSFLANMADGSMRKPVPLTKMFY